jgi:predicted O-methyltransferase YrrM
MTTALEAYAGPEAPDNSLLAAAARLVTAGDGLDQLHCRSRQATSELAALARLRPGMRVLDVGSGLGGPARHLAGECGVRVTGLEPVEASVRIARLLTRHARMEHLVAFERGSALAAGSRCSGRTGCGPSAISPPISTRAGSVW